MLASESIVIMAEREQWEFDDSESSSDALDWGNEGIPDIADFEDSDKVVSAAEMKKAAFLKETKGVVQKLREKYLSDKKRAEKASKKVDTTLTKREKIRAKERQMINIEKTSKAKGYWVNKAGDWSLKSSRVEDVEEDQGRFWGTSMNFPVKSKKDKKKKALSPPKTKQIDFDRKLVLDVKKVSSVAWGSISDKLRESYVDFFTIQTNSSPADSGMSPKVLDNVRDYYFSNADGELSVYNVISEWFYKVSLLSGSLSVNSASVSSWLANSWLSSENFFKLDIEILFPELFLNKAFLKLDDTGASRVAEIFEEYIVNTASIRTINAIRLVNMVDPTAKLTTMDTPAFPPSLFKFIDSMKQNCWGKETNLDIPIPRIVGYANGGEIMCGDLLEFKRLVDEGDIGEYPGNFVELINSLNISKSPAPIEIDDGYKESVKKEPDSYNHTDLFSTLMSILDKEKMDVEVKRKKGITHKCEKCRMKIKDSRWITSNYVGGKGDILRFCSRECFDGHDAEIESEYPPIIKNRMLEDAERFFDAEVTLEKLRAYNRKELKGFLQDNNLSTSGRNYERLARAEKFLKNKPSEDEVFIKNLKQEFKALYEVATDPSVEKPEFMDRAISTGETLEDALFASDGTTPKLKKVRSKLQILRDVKSGKMSLMDAIEREKRNTKDAEIEKTIANLQKYNKKELEDFLRDAELSTAGKKGELLARAENFVNGVSGERDDDDGDDGDSDLFNFDEVPIAEEGDDKDDKDDKDEKDEGDEAEYPDEDDDEDDDDVGGIDMYTYT
jgi:hypothetical protein